MVESYRLKLDSPPFVVSLSNHDWRAPSSFDKLRTNGSNVSQMAQERPRDEGVARAAPERPAAQSWLIPQSNVASGCWAASYPLLRFPERVARKVSQQHDRQKPQDSSGHEADWLLGKAHCPKIAMVFEASFDQTFEQHRRTAR